MNASISYPFATGEIPIHAPEPHKARSPLSDILDLWNHEDADTLYAVHHPSSISRQNSTRTNPPLTLDEYKGTLIMKQVGLVTSKLQYLRSLLIDTRLTPEQREAIDQFALLLDETRAVIRQPRSEAWRLGDYEEPDRQEQYGCIPDEDATELDSPQARSASASLSTSSLLEVLTNHKSPTCGHEIHVLHPTKVQLRQVKEAAIVPNRRRPLPRPPTACPSGSVLSLARFNLTSGTSGAFANPWPAATITQRKKSPPVPRDTYERRRKGKGPCQYAMVASITSFG